MDYLTLIADRIPSMLAYWDADLRCRYANRAYRDWFGVEPQELIGRRLPDLLGPELYRLNEPYVRVALQGVEQRFERDVPGPGGVRRSLVRYLPDRRDGTVVGFIAYVTDVTPLKSAQDRLRLARRRTALAARNVRRRAAALREAQRVAHIGSWEWRIDGDQVVWSTELYRIFGRDPAKPSPPYVEQGELYLPDSWQTLRSAVARTLNEGASYELELEFRHPDGSNRWIEARGEPLRDVAGQIAGVRGTAHDITWRRMVEDARLKVRVAESASRNKTELLSRASHELRTPLNAILGFGQLLHHQAALPDQQRQWLDLMLDSGRHMLALTEDLLDVAAAESGGLAVISQIVDLQAIVDGTLAALAPQAREAGMRIDVTPAPLGLRLVTADPARTRQIVINLLSNALKYGKPGPTVSVSFDADEAGMRCLHVQDGGPGLDEAQIGQLFKPFHRLGAQSSTVQGAGLGLALSRHLAELMGGRLFVTSQPGVGSRFTLALPAASAANDMAGHVDSGNPGRLPVSSSGDELE